MARNTVDVTFESKQLIEKLNVVCVKDIIEAKVDGDKVVFSFTVEE